MAITDVQTDNVVGVRTGTGWTIDVTACNLLTNLSVKDFIVLLDGSVASNNDFTKNTATLLVYSGAAVPTNTSVEVRRETPVELVKVVQFGDRFASDDWNTELAYRARWQAEANLNGKGAGTTVSSVIPLNDPFSASWDNDVIRPATRNALYDELILKADLSSPALTGNPTAPTPITADNDTSIATTAYVKSNLISYATLASPTFTGVPTAPNPAYGLDSTALATTAYARDILTPAVAANLSNAINFPHSTTTDVVFNDTEFDTDSMYNSSTGLFTIPTGRAGWYMVFASIRLDGTAINNFSFLSMSLATAAGSGVRLMYQLADPGASTGNGTMLTSSAFAFLSAGTSYKITVFQQNGSSTTATNSAGTSARNKLFVMRLPF